MNLGIVGSRTFSDYTFLSKTISELIHSENLNYPEITIISGGARGADSLAHKFAVEHCISQHTLLPDYSRYGNAAPFIRNNEIVRNSDMIVAFWDGISKGTQDTINKARKAGKKVLVYYFDSLTCKEGEQ